MEYKELVHEFLVKYGIVAPPGWDGYEVLEIDDVSVNFRVDEAAGELILSAEVGDMPPDEKGRFASLLLKASGLLSSNAEGAFCVDEDDVFYAVRSFPLAIADVHTLVSALEALVDLVELWREHAAAFASVDDELAQKAIGEAALNPLFGNADFIRI